MRLSTGLRFLLALWVLAEVLVFALVARVIGVPESLLVALVTSLFGWTLLKRAGAAAMIKLRALLEGRAAEPDGPRFLDDGLATAGAVALLVPGFLSDAVGLVLAVPLVRNRLAGWIGQRGIVGLRRRTGRRPAQPGTIDLAPDDWRRTDAPTSVPKA